MRIYTLGTSHGIAEKGRVCSGHLLQAGSSSYLFDCGGDVDAKMTNLDLPVHDIKCIFISHMHEDHVRSLSGIVKRFIRHGISLKVFMPEQSGIDAFQNWLNVLHIGWDDSVVSYELVRPGVVYSDENVTVTAIETHHIERGKFPSFAYMVEAENKRFLYTGDLAGDFHDYPQILFQKEFDAVLCELVHFDVDNNLQTLINTKTKHLIFTHLKPQKAEMIESHKKEFPFAVDIANDCDFYDI